ncbi:MAG: bifunctional phosphoribosylaminoimidazolecarboxamide formyltransferase/IMP cyclohydrolase [Planctomycetota bacterium]
MIQRALLSVSDKTGLADLARSLAARGVELLSTGGTAEYLKKEGLKVTLVSDVTGFPEIMDGRVKTLHPRIHGGLLARRADSRHMATAKEQGIGMIDLVVVNLYPFEATRAKPGVSDEEVIENIDIGGPSMLRSAAKNFESVTVLCDPADYPRFLEAFGKGGPDLTLRRELAGKVYALTSRYDAAIADHVARQDPEVAGNISLSLFLAQQLRYGENPHQKAGLYLPKGAAPQGVAGARQLHGKPLSYNNLLDADAAWNLVREFEEPACAVIKHTNPCGCALGSTPAGAFLTAWECDSVSAFGSILAFNRPVDEAVAEAIVEGRRFVEVICASGFTNGAKELLAGRKGWGADLRLLEIPASQPAPQIRSLSGGFLVQDEDTLSHERFEEAVRPVSADEKRDLLFAWKVCKHVKSNAIVLAKEGRLVGVGAGQMNRLASVRLATAQAGPLARGSVMASDAFFPFPDSIEEAAPHGITAVIQPGGSKKDDEVVAACRRLGLALVLTGTRHFRHG